MVVFDAVGCRSVGLILFLFFVLLSGPLWSKEDISEFIESPYVGAPLPSSRPIQELKRGSLWNKYRSACFFMYDKSSGITSKLADKLLGIMVTHPSAFKCVMHKSIKFKTTRVFLKIKSADIDGDGVENVFDAHPYSFLKFRMHNHDSDGDGIFDHLDWDVDGDGVSELTWVKNADELAVLQKKIYGDFKISVIARSGYPSIHTLRSIYEVLSVIFAPYIVKRGKFKHLDKILTMDKNFAPDKRRSLAYYSHKFRGIYLSNRLIKMSVQEIANEKRSMSFYHALIHELGHALHYSEDDSNGRNSFDKFLGYFWQHSTKDLKGQSRNLYYSYRASLFMPRKEGLLEAFYTETERLINSSFAIEKEVRELKSLLAKPSYNYQMWLRVIILSTKIYQRELGKKQNHPVNEEFAKRENLFTDYPLAKKLNIVSIYSLLSASEFYAENLTAYALHQIYKERMKTLPADEQKDFWDYVVNALSTRGGIGELNINNIAPEAFDYFDNLLELSHSVEWVAGSSSKEYGWETGHGGFWRMKKI